MIGENINEVKAFIFKLMLQSFRNLLQQVQKNEVNQKSGSLV